MNKFAIIVFAIVATAVVAAAAAPMKTQCTPEPLTMLALIPGITMLIRRRKQS